MANGGPEPFSWEWKPLTKFSIDVEIGGKRIVAEVDAKDRQKVAEGLARLADAAMGGTRRLVWRWDDGAEWDLDGNNIKEADDD